MAAIIRILGVDPGSRHTGFGIIDVHGQRLVPVAWGRFSPPSSETLPQRLAHLVASLRTCVREHTPLEAAVESPFHGVNTRSLVVLAQARGALLAALAESQVALSEYSPAEVKSAVTSNGRADKNQVARMVRAILGPAVSDASEDASDALALAICHAHRRTIDRLHAAR